MATAWRESLQQGMDWFNERPIRERALITGTVVALVLFVGWELAVAPAYQAKQNLESRLTTLSVSRDQLLTEQQALTQRLEEDPSGALRAQLKTRQERLLRLDQQIADKTRELIAPKAMVSLLRNMLDAQGALALQSLVLKAPEPVFAPGVQASAAAQASDSEAPQPLLYAHDVELRVQGGYLDVLAYLQRLEALDEGLGWVMLEYNAERWPKGEAVIQVRTLGLVPAWLGV